MNAATALAAFGEREAPVARPRRRLSLAPGRASVRLAKATMFSLETLQWTREHFDVVERGVPHDLQRRVHHLQWVAENMCALHGIEVITRGEIPTEPAIFVANHLGYLDPIALNCSLACAPVAKREVQAWPVIGEAIARLGGLFVDRDCPHSGAKVLLRAKACLDAGVSVLAFPEGTTSRGETVLPMKRGMFGLAALTGKPIVPTAISHDDPATAWVDDELFAPHYLRLAGRSVTRIRVCYGTPIDPPANGRAEALTEQVRETIAAMLPTRST